MLKNKFPSANRKTMKLFFLIIFWCLFSTCKKISKHPFNMYGEWVSYGGSSCDMNIIIDKKGNGEYFTFSADKGCNQKSFSGKVRFTKNHLYIGGTKFGFVTKPTLLEKGDSIEECSPSSWKNRSFPCLKKHPKIAVMSLQNSVFHSKELITYVKIIDY